MSRWEYCILEYTETEFSIPLSRIEGNMDTLGDDGWELADIIVSPHNGFIRMFFKREINE